MYARMHVCMNVRQYSSLLVIHQVDEICEAIASYKACFLVALAI